MDERQKILHNENESDTDNSFLISLLSTLQQYNIKLYIIIKLLWYKI